MIVELRYFCWKEIFIVVLFKNYYNIIIAKFLASTIISTYRYIFPSMINEVILSSAEGYRMRRKRTRRKRKKTFIWLFKYNQKRCKSRPTTLKDPVDNRFNILRYGVFKQSRDVRSEFCPYKGFKHQTLVRPSIKCPCRHRPFCPTSLSAVYSSAKLTV